MYTVRHIIVDILNLLFINESIKGFYIIMIDPKQIDWTVITNNEECVGGILEANEHVEISDLRELIFKAIEEVDEEFVRPYRMSDLMEMMDEDEIAEARERAIKEGQELCNDFVEDDDVTDEVTIFSTMEPHVIHKEG